MVTRPLREEPQKEAGAEVLTPFKSTLIINSSDLTVRTVFACWVCTEDGGYVPLTAYFVKALLKPADCAGLLLIQNTDLHLLYPCNL